MKADRLRPLLRVSAKLLGSTCLFLLIGAAGSGSGKEAAKRPELGAARGALLAEADRALRAGPFSVMDKKLVPPSGDKHDYMSTGPYWWPDPTKPNGLPYVRRDGERNPDHDTSQTDSHSFQTMLAAVQTLSLAFRERGDERHAAHALELLRVWFIKSATRMNPKLDYGQGIAGKVQGRGAGIIETRGLANLTSALEWLSRSKAWTEGDRQGMKTWLSQYLDWLLTSENGRKEAAARNNHGSWYDVQVAALALFAGNQEIPRRVIEEAKKKRIATQIEPDGRQPFELERTKSFSYCLFNLQALYDLAALGDRMGVDLWHFQTADGRSLRSALDFLAPYVDASRKWPYPQFHGIGLEDRLALAALLRRAALVYREPRYEAFLKMLPAKELGASRMQILWPPA